MKTVKILRKSFASSVMKDYILKKAIFENWDILDQNLNSFKRK